MGARTLILARQARLAGTLTSIIISAATAGRAQTTPIPAGAATSSAIVLLRLPKCDASSFDADAFFQLLTIELLTAELKLVRDELASPSPEMILEISARACDPRARELTIAISHGRAGDRREHSIALYDVEQRARPRALALAMAELIRQRRAESGTSGAVPDQRPAEGPEAFQVERPSDARPLDSAAPTTRERERLISARPPRGPDLQLAAHGRLFAAESTLLLGAGVAASLALGTAWLRGRADLAGHWGGLDDPLGTVNMGLYSGGLAVLAQTGENPALVIGPHLELGYAHATGTPIALRSEARNDGQIVALASLIAGTRFRFHRWAAAFELNFGTSLRGAEIFADDRRIAAMQGVFAGARVGIAYEY